MKRLLKHEDGFTLVELMVVVAIIGLLSAVAIPNFKKYQAKAKIAEAKLHLSAIYTAEAGFFSDYNMYAVCLRYMGYDPFTETANRYYATGFLNDGQTTRDSSAHASAVNSGLNTVACGDIQQAADSATSTNPTATYFVAGKGIGNRKAIVLQDWEMNPAYAEIYSGTQADAANMIYTAAAIGYISAEKLTQEECSGLTIDQNKVLRNVVNGY